MIVVICDLSVEVARTQDLPAKQAWTLAVKYVRELAFADGVRDKRDGWYCTSNRAVYASGIYRATSLLADRKQP